MISTKSIGRVILTILAVFVISANASAGKPVKTAEEAKKAALTWLEGFLEEEDTRDLLSEFKDVSGTQTWDIVVAAKGSTDGWPTGRAVIQTVFLAETNIEDHRFNGRFKDLIRDKKFDWKINKDQPVKITYTFDIK